MKDATAAQVLSIVLRNTMWLVAILPLFLSAAAAAALAPGQSGVISFQSVTPANYGELVFRTYSTAPVTISGTLSLPANAPRPVPAIIVRHSCGGVNAGDFSWAQTLNNMGVAAFVLDSFTGRGISSTCTGQQSLSGAADVADAFKALELLATHPDINPNRIGILGRSRGGTPALQTAFEELRTGVISGNLKFAAHIAFYPACNSRLWSVNMTGAPILNLLGEADDYTPAYDCALYAELMASVGTDVTTIIYPEAYHVFDSQAPVTWLPDVRTQRACAGEFRVGTSPFQFRRYDNGQTFSNGTEFNSYLNSCAQVGATIGGNAGAFAQSQTDIAIFLARVFGLTLALPQSQPDRIFNWIEDTYPQFLQPTGAASRSRNGYYYRYYRDTNVYIGVKDGRLVYYMPSVDPNTIVDFGAEGDFLNQASQARY